MSVLTISLSDDVQEWVEQEAASSGASVDDFVSQLARQAKEQAQQANPAQKSELEKLLLEAVNSPEPAQVADARWWADLRAEVEDELAQKSVATHGASP